MQHYHDDDRPARYALRCTSEPFAEPVDLDEMKAHLRLDGPDDDALVSAWTTAARRYVEDVTARQLVVATYRLTLDEFPCGLPRVTDCMDWRAYARAAAVALPIVPLVTVSSVTYDDSTGTTQTLDPATYRVDAESEPSVITPAYAVMWPITRCQTGAVTITFTAGHMTPFTADPTTDVFTAQGRTYTDGDAVRLKNSGGALPGGLAENTLYYVRDSGGSTFNLAATLGGTAIDIATAGQGTHFASNPSAGFSDVEGLRAAVKLLVGHWNENREAVGTVGGPVALAVESLVWQKRVFI